MTVTRFIIWNSGTEEIKREDLYADRLLSVKSTKFTQILDASTVKGSDPEHKFTALVDNNTVTIDFECAETQDGVVIQVIHDGDASDLKLTVGIKGGKDIREYQIDSGKDRKFGLNGQRKKITFILLGIYLSLMGFTFLAGLLTLLHVYTPPVIILENEEKFRCFSVLSEGILLLVVGYSYIGKIKKEYNFSIPSRLRKYVSIISIWRDFLF